MNHSKLGYIVIMILIMASSCSKIEKYTIEVHNTLDIGRTNETVKVNLEEIGLLHQSLTDILVKNQETGDEVLNQLIDKDNDGLPESILFQTDILSKETKTFEVLRGKSLLEVSKLKTFARFVPERTDDFAWENDRVAFRTYGPEAQRMVEENIPGGTLSSGIDCWLKKVNYSIIDVWYERNTNGGNYHEDVGEGLDNYHVGPSRGCGGIGVWKNNKMFTSKNYSDYKVISNGPIRSSFVLNYENWKVGDAEVEERKLISIDLGTNFTKHEVSLKGIDTITVGITLHDKEGEVSVSKTDTWFNYTTPHFGKALSTALIFDPKYYAGHTIHKSLIKDESHMFVHLKVIEDIVVYYAGFNWSESKQFTDKQAWENYLSQLSRSITKPLQISYKR